MSVRRAVVVPVVLVGAVFALGACQSAQAGSASQPAPQASSAGAAAGAAAPGDAAATGGAEPGAAAPSAAAPAGGAAAPAPARAGAGTGTGPVSVSSAAPGGKPAGGAAAGGTTAGAGADGDAYAYGHPCESGNLVVRVTVRPEAPWQRVIEVRNQGPRSCGLSYYPLVSLGDSHAADHSKDVRPLVPGGLGGAPAYPLAAGRSAYAVIDLNPGGAAAGTPGIDQLNVLADGDHMPTADTRNFPLGTGAKVLKPKLGLYRSTVADAAASAAGADRSS